MACQVYTTSFGIPTHRIANEDDLLSEIIIIILMECVCVCRAHVTVTWMNVQYVMVAAARCFVIEHTFSNENFIQNFCHFDGDNIY